MRDDAGVHRGKFVCIVLWWWGELLSHVLRSRFCRLNFSSKFCDNFLLTSFSTLSHALGKSTLLTQSCQEANIRLGMSLTIVVIFFTVLFLCVLGLAFFVFQLSSHYNSLTHGVTDASLKTVLGNLLKEISTLRRDIGQLRDRVDVLERDGAGHIQKIGLMRFNPFKDTGGNQSFIVSLVDAKENGVIISALYSRSGTRWYAKQVVKGKGIEHELSDEEKIALKEATAANHS